MKLLAKGAEAEIFEMTENILKKSRSVKTYRIKEIDEKLRKFRNKREFKVLTTLSENNIFVPKPFEISIKDDIYFTFEYIRGNVLKDVLNLNYLERAFDHIIKIHNLDIIHGDLTTLNMIEKENEVYIIDFGLSEFSAKIEDKAVDLNLFFTCIKNEHSDFYKYKEKLLKEYSKKVELGENIIKRLKKIEHRGRNK